MNIFKRHAMWALPILVMLLITPFTSTLDLWVANMAFYGSSHEATTHGFFTTPFLDFIYLYGVVPAQIICGASTLVLILSFWAPRFVPFRNMCAALSLTLCVGSGLITHSVLKEFWGRPRPRQIVEFGGNQQFRAYYQPLFTSAPEPSRSFPSGHSTCGFYFFSLFFLARRLNKKGLAWSSLAFSLILGGLLSLARIVQGGHFISDVLIAALIMWETAYVADYLMFEKKWQHEPAR